MDACGGGAIEGELYADREFDGRWVEAVGGEVA
jgi:hypothetical protein